MSALVPSDDMIVCTVDDHDAVVGTIARKLVLPTGFNFRVAHLLLENSRGEILLQQLASTRQRHPLAWGASVACYLFANETYEAAIRRRVVQELGCEPRDLRFLTKTEMLDGKSKKFIEIFTGHAEAPFDFDASHIKQVEFVAPGQIEDELKSGSRVFTPTFRHIFALAMTAQLQLLV